jgi:geranylgeranyl pyrophosphate synthase
MSYFQEFYHDFANCFENPNGRDIQDGKLTWLIVVACQRANSKQKNILHECYGAGDDDSEAEAKTLAVKKVYKELNLKKALQMSLDNTKSDVHQRIQGLSKVDKIGLSPPFFFKLLDQMSLIDIS